MGAQKYLRESCYHRIEYSAANSLTALIRKWSLNSVFLVLQLLPKTLGGGGWDRDQLKQSTVHVYGKDEKRRWYKLKRGPWEKGSEICKKKHCNNLNHIYNHFQSIYINTYLFRLCQEQIYLDNSNPFLFDYLLKSILIVIPFIRA